MELTVTNGSIPPEEKQQYISYIEQKYHRLPIKQIYLALDGDYINITVEPERRVLTKMGGVLIGDPFTWNNAKRAEYFDTVPNSIEDI